MNASDELKKHNLKLTPQRIAIYSFLCSTTSHPTADEIYNKIHADYPSMSLATVYKTLDTLSKSNLIQVLNVGEDCFRYDAQTNSHPHAICINCHKVFDLNIVLDDILKDKVNKETDFEFVGQQIYCYVKCKSC